MPGLPISMTVPLLLLWACLALFRGVVELDARRTVIWLLAAGVSGLLMVPQSALVLFPLISVNSWLLWMVTWLPMVFRFTDRSPQAYDTTLRGVAWAGLGLAGLSIVFTLSQVLGIRYRDIFAEVVPDALQLQGFVITYPIAWESPIYKSNAWLALEPSFLSFMLGVAMVSALISLRHPLLVIGIGLGLLCTTAGSGMAVAGVYLIAALLSGRGRALTRYLIVAIPLAVIGALTALGDSVLDRLTEAGDARSSTALRMIEPYTYLVPQWLSDPVRMLVGGGPGSSQRVVDDVGVLGLLVPTPAKMLYDYGLIGGLLMLAMILVVYLRSPAPELAVALAVSMLTLQGAAQPLVAMSLLMISLFAPVARASVEPDPVAAPAVVLRQERPSERLTARQPVGGP
ncbi:MAG: hypothetical protein IPL41_17655 [Micropruina sp.]|nr:hypothetical protein [Micropruina sp.]